MKNLKAVRKMRGISQAQIAKELGITRQAYGNYESGNRQPSFETLLKMSECFNVSADALLRDELPVQEDEQLLKNPDIRLIARASKRMTPEQARTILKYAQFMFPEAFENVDS